MENSLPSKPQENCVDCKKYLDAIDFLLSQEIRTPLTIIKSYLWMILAGKSGEVPEGIRTYVDKAYNSTNNLLYSISKYDDYIKMAGKQIKYSIKACNLIDVVKKVVDEISPKIIDKGISLKIESDINNVYVFGDPDKLRLVLIEILNVFTEFTAEGDIKIIIEESDREVMVSIGGTDSMLEKSEIKKILKKFNSTRIEQDAGRIKESGLGLEIAKRYILGMKGKSFFTRDTEGNETVLGFILPKKM